MLASTLARRHQRCPSNRRNGFISDSTSLTVLSVDPNCQGLLTLAGVAPNATAHNILSGDDASVVNDMFPRGPSASRQGLRRETDTAIDAAGIASDRFSLKPLRDVPAIHLGDVADVVSRDSPS